MLSNYDYDFHDFHLNSVSIKLAKINQLLTCYMWSPSFVICILFSYTTALGIVFITFLSFNDLDNI